MSVSPLYVHASYTITNTMTGSLIEICKRRCLSIPDAYIENIITRKVYLPLYHDVHFSFNISRVDNISRKVVKRLLFVEKSKRVVPTMSPVCTLSSTDGINTNRLRVYNISYTVYSLDMGCCSWWVLLFHSSFVLLSVIRVCQGWETLPN